MDVIEKMLEMVRDGRIDEILAEARNGNRLAQDFLAEEEEGREDRDTWLSVPGNRERLYYSETFLEDDLCEECGQSSEECCCEDE